MKFIHISDIHLGKIIYQKNLLPLQIDLLKQVIDYLVTHEIDVLVIAGDIYDRAISSNESIETLDWFLNSLINKHHKKVLMISGNHDSNERLNFVSKLLEKQGLYIVAFPEKKIKPIVIDDVNFYLVPYFKPTYIAYLYQHESFVSYQEAFEYYLSKQDIDYTKTNVLVTHQFIAGNKEVIKSDSEVILSVGGSEIIDVESISQFDYVALGHLHACQKIKYDYVRYAGSLMKYSFDEVNQKKGMLEVEIEDKKVQCKMIPLKPQIDLIKVKGYFKDLLENEINNQDYVSVDLSDTSLIPHANERLKNVYHHILQLTYPYLIQHSSSNQTKANQGFEQKGPLEILEEFYLKMKGEAMDLQTVNLVKDLIEEETQSDT